MGTDRPGQVTRDGNCVVAVAVVGAVAVPSCVIFNGLWIERVCKVRDVGGVCSNRQVDRVQLKNILDLLAVGVGEDDKMGHRRILAKDVTDI